MTELVPEVTLKDDPATRKWHIDRRIPLALIFAIGLQIAGFIWAGAQLFASVGRLDERVTALEQQAKTTIETSNRIVRVETKLDAVGDRLDRMGDLLRELLVDKAAEKKKKGVAD